ncbi:MAG: DUF4034 domain-containing protein [Pseudomonadota bacterium]
MINDGKFLARMKRLATAGILFSTLFASAANAEIVGFNTINHTGEPAAMCFEKNTHKMVSCPDSVRFNPEGSGLVVHLFNNQNFDRLEKLFDQWCTGKDRFADGLWKLPHFSPKVEGALGFRSLNQNMEAVQSWQKAKPGSVAAKFFEAALWKSYAWKSRGDAFANMVSKESWTLFHERLGNADLILTEIEGRAKSCPAWYEEKIETLVAMGKGAEARKVFDEGVKTFPKYHQIYFAIARIYEPKWGGSVEAYNAFAHEAVRLAKGFEGGGMYARLFWLVDGRFGIPFVSENKYPEWKYLQAGYDDLMRDYPNSAHNTNRYAAVACRSNDSVLYRTLRSRTTDYLVSSMFDVDPVDVCDRRHKFKTNSMM